MSEYEVFWLKLLWYYGNFKKAKKQILGKFFVILQVIGIIVIKS